MTWKSYAAASGATVLAGWLASTPPVDVVENRHVAQSRTSRAAAVSPSSDIVEQATRLQARIRRETAYVRPQRNPFQFEAPRPAAETRATIVEPLPIDLSVPEIHTAPSVTLAGVAEDSLQSGVERTAILSSPTGVLVVRIGDEVLGQYRVAAIEETAVELLSLTDGSTLRLSLAR